MARALRTLLTGIAGIATFYFTMWMCGALLYGLGLRGAATFGWIAPVLGAMAAIGVARFVWRRSGNRGLMTAVATGAFVTGGIGFSAGFFGPIVFMPDANQGPLLGIFITGPLGFVAGAIGGAIYWSIKRRQAHASSAR